MAYLAWAGIWIAGVLVLSLVSFERRELQADLRRAAREPPRSWNPALAGPLPEPRLWL
jgi:hypothetical protein